jgi:MFS family permease
MTTDLYALGIRARNAVWACFFFLGFLGLAWIPRIPEIKTALNLSDGQFGLVLLSSTVGSIPGAQLAGRMVHTYSSKLVVQISGFLLPVGVLVVGLAGNVQTLVLGLFITGFNVSLWILRLMAKLSKLKNIPRVAGCLVFMDCGVLVHLQRP